MKPCNKCGVKRKIQIKAEVYQGTTTMGLKRICVLCLLKGLGIIDCKFKIDKNLIMDSDELES